MIEKSEEFEIEVNYDTDISKVVESLKKLGLKEINGFVESGWSSSFRRAGTRRVKLETYSFRGWVTKSEVGQFLKRNKFCYSVLRELVFVVKEILENRNDGRERVIIAPGSFCEALSSSGTFVPCFFNLETWAAPQVIPLNFSPHVDMLVLCGDMEEEEEE